MEASIATLRHIGLDQSQGRPPANLRTDADIQDIAVQARQQTANGNRRHVATV